MNVHDRTLELAATAMDFGLATAERRALADHLNGCSRCRGDVTGLEDDARRIAARPMRTLAPARAVVLRERVVHSGSGWRPALVLVTVGLLVLLGLAAATAGGLADRLFNRREPLATVPLPTVVAADGWSAGALFSDEGGDGSIGSIYGGASSGWISIANRCGAPVTPPGDCTVEIRWSADGLTWPTRGTQVHIVPPSGASTESWYPVITDVAAADDGFVATVYSMTDGIDGASAWWSPDGRQWQRRSLGAGSRAATVIRTAEGWMIGGSIERGDQQLAAIWTSPDGRAWTRNADDPIFAVGELDRSLEGRMEPGVRDMAALGDLVVATGIACSPTLVFCAGAAWISEDGRTWKRDDPDTGIDLPHFTTALGAGIVTMAYTDSVFTRVYAYDPGAGWSLLKGDLGFVQEAVPALGGVAVATGDGAGVSDVMTIRFSSDGRTWSEVGTIDPPDVPTRSGVSPLSNIVSLSEAPGVGVQARWQGVMLEPEVSADWVFRTGIWLFERTR